MCTRARALTQQWLEPGELIKPRGPYSLHKKLAGKIHRTYIADIRTSTIIFGKLCSFLKCLPHFRFPMSPVLNLEGRRGLSLPAPPAPPCNLYLSKEGPLDHGVPRHDEKNRSPGQALVYNSPPRSQQGEITRKKIRDLVALLCSVPALFPIFLCYKNGAR